MALYLPVYEIALYFSVYAAILFFSVTDVLRICDEKIPGYIYHDLGWDFLKRRRDNADFEWEAWRDFLLSTVLLYAVYLAISELCRWFRLKAFSYVSVLFGLLVVNHICGFGAVCLLLAKSLTAFFVGNLKKKSLIWVNVFVWMFLMNVSSVERFFESLTTKGQYGETLYFLYVAMGWNTLKCVSFTVDKIADDGRSLHFTLIDFLGYVFYPPTLFIGPVVLFGRHREMLLTFGKRELQVARRTWQLVKSVLYCWALFLFTQFCLHFLYINHFRFQHKEILPMLNSWGIYGYGYLMGTFFHIKYVIYYGIGSAMGTFDSISMPARPRCISRTHRYTDMWKHFDRGLYEFLFKYIYAELCSRTSSYVRRLGATLATFTFIYLWHGLLYSILVWAALNFVCVTAENFLAVLTSSQKYRSFVGQFLSPAGELRLNALLGANVMLPSILSNFVFFADVEVGREFFKKTYSSGIKFYAVVMLVCYSVYNLGEWISRVEASRKVKSKEK